MKVSGPEAMKVSGHARGCNPRGSSQASALVGICFAESLMQGPRVHGHGGLGIPASLCVLPYADAKFDDRRCDTQALARELQFGLGFTKFGSTAFPGA